MSLRRSFIQNFWFPFWLLTPDFWLLFSNFASFFISRFSALVSHSQIIITRQPSFFKRRVFRRSRSTFRLNFSCQKASLLFGVLACLQPWCRCQKQPRTSITVLYFGSTISGFPGRSFRCSRKRYPIPCSNDLTSLSGLVFSDRIRLIFQLRCCLDIVSI